MDKIKILIFEDSLLAAKDLELKLQKYHYHICDTIDQGEKGLSIVGKYLPDVILLDIILAGGMDGIDAAKEIRSQYHIPIIFLTSSEEGIVFERAKDSGAYGYILKPANERELYITIEMALHKNRLEQELLEKEEWFSTIFDNTNEGIVVTDHNGIIKSVNTAFTHITGFHKEEAIGKNPRILKSDRHEPGFYKQMWDSLIHHRAWEGEIWNRKKNGEVYPEWMTISAINDNKGKIVQFVGLFNDISELKKKEEDCVMTVKFKKDH